MTAHHTNGRDPQANPARTPLVLMCPPDHYGIEYEINPWMDVKRGAIPELAQSQWGRLRATIESLGAEVEVVEARPHLPDLVFTANAGLVFGNTFVGSNFRHSVRQGESPVFDAWFAERGWNVVRPPSDIYFEGAGDALFCGETLFFGYKFRSQPRGHAWLGELLSVEVLPVELADDRYYHLDTCFCPLDATSAIIFPGAFDSYGLTAIRDRVPVLIEADPTEAEAFCCNAVVIGRDVILNDISPRLADSLGEHGFRTHPLGLSEFIKSGGSAKCLTLRLDGEEAAAWAKSGSLAASK
jgi:N-dimethylarginine dimethylaminohydrolase